MPVVVVGGQPVEVGGRAGRAGMLVEQIRRGTMSTILGVGPDMLTGIRHITWIATPDDEVDQVDAARDAYVRQDRAGRGVGFGLRHAAREFAGANAWSWGALAGDSVAGTETAES